MVKQAVSGVGQQLSMIPSINWIVCWMLCWPRMDWRRRAGAPHCNPHRWMAMTEVMLLAGDGLLLIWHLKLNFNVKEISIPPQFQTTHTWAAASEVPGDIWRTRSELSYGCQDSLGSVLVSLTSDIILAHMGLICGLKMCCWRFRPGSILSVITGPGWLTVIIAKL